MMRYYIHPNREIIYEYDSRECAFKYHTATESKRINGTLPYMNYNEEITEEEFKREHIKLVLGK